MKWDKVAILFVGKMDSTIEESGLQYIRKYNIPPDLVITEEAIMSPEYSGKFRFYQTLALYGKITKFSKLIIIGHGNSFYSGRKSPMQLAIYIEKLGITNVGLISFKACGIGRDFFLESFAEESNGIGLRFGWCLGYKNSVSRVWDSEGIGFVDFFLRSFSAGRVKLPDSSRIKIIKGDLDFPASFTHTLGSRFT